MKKEQRQKWLNYIYLLDHDPFTKQNKANIICEYCKYFEIQSSYDYWSGNNEYEPICNHSLDIIRDSVFDNALFGSDCWAFRPKFKLLDLCKDYCSEQELELDFSIYKFIQYKSCTRCSINYHTHDEFIQGLCPDCSEQWMKYRKEVLK